MTREEIEDILQNSIYVDVESEDFYDIYGFKKASEIIFNKIQSLQKENEILKLEKELLETKLQQSESIWKDEKTGLGNIIAELEVVLKELKGE